MLLWILHQNTKFRKDLMLLNIIGNMIKNIEPYYSTTNSCVENLQTSICKMLNRDFRNMYAYSWNFGYDQAAELLADRIKTSRDRQRRNCEEEYALEMLCGIKTIWHIKSDRQRFEKIVKKEIDAGRPVAVGIDIYSCYWHKFYHKYHFLHFCLIIGIDEKGFICIDDTLENKDEINILVAKDSIIHISYRQYQENCNCFITFQFKDKTEKIEEERIVYWAALKTLLGYQEKSDFDYMRLLKKDIVESFDISKEVNDEHEPRAIPIIRSFACISWSRKNYVSFLSNLKTKMINPTIIENINESSKLWMGISNYILMYMVKNKKGFDYIQLENVLQKIIELEEKTAYYIVEEFEKRC